MTRLDVQLQLSTVKRIISTLTVFLRDIIDQCCYVMSHSRRYLDLSASDLDRWWFGCRRHEQEVSPDGLESRSSSKSTEIGSRRSCIIQSLSSTRRPRGEEHLRVLEKVSRDT